MGYQSEPGKKKYREKIGHYLYIIRYFLLKYGLIFLPVLKLFDEPLRRVKYRKMSKKYQMVFQRKAPNNIFIVRLKNSPPGVKVGVQIE